MSEKPVRYGGSLGIGTLAGFRAPDDIVVLNESKPTEDQIRDLITSSPTYDRPPVYKAPDTITVLKNMRKPKPEEIRDLT
jgi:hypothetical protein